MKWERTAVIAMFLMMLAATVMAAIDISTAIISGIFVTTPTATGYTIIGMNWLFIIGYILSTILIPFVIEWIKKKWTTMLQKAWMPIVLGTLIWIATGLVTRQITGWGTLMTYLFLGISSGGIASSGRDFIVGK